MNIFEIRSPATVSDPRLGFPRGIRRIFSDRRSCERVARLDTTAEERTSAHGRVGVRCIYGPQKGDFWC